jgi:alkylhydroperoxidase/carboxymuconolactone decarboxylase family protein YurZ
MTRSTQHRRTSGYEETLRRLSLHDEAFVAAMMGEYVGVRRAGDVDDKAQMLDDRTRRLVILGALIAIDAGPAAIDAAVAAAFGAGATTEDVVDVLLVVAPAVGTARVVTAAPFVAASVGYDLDGAFEGIPRQPLPRPREGSETR